MALPHEFRRNISKEEVSSLPIRRYEGEIVLVEDARALERAAGDIHAERVVGFDTETRPTFRVGESYPPALAQIATARVVYLFPLQRLDCSAVLAPMLQAAHIVKAGISLADDLKKLKQMLHFEEAGVLDLGHVAARHGLKQTGLRNLTGLLLGTRIPKGAKTTNWAVRHLSQQQITYAATDAWACRELYLKFEEMALL
jgi:ribonuclease D